MYSLLFEEKDVNQPLHTVRDVLARTLFLFICKNIKCFSETRGISDKKQVNKGMCLSCWIM